MNKLVVISDECYERLVFDKNFISIEKLNQNHNIGANVLTCMSLSKTYSMTGWRIGYAAGPDKIIKEMKKIQSQSTSNPNSIAQAAAVAALNGKQDFIKECVNIYKERHDIIIKLLKEIDGIEILESEGTFYTFPDMNNIINRLQNISNDIELAEFFIEEAGVAMVPGSAFGVPGCMRISFATNMENIKEGIRRIKDILLNS